jgi:hypothetical protein
VRPDGEITRAEVAVIFFRLIKDTGKNDEIAGAYPDVPRGEWYAQAVNYLSKLGIFNGYEDGTFRPDQNITRAEFAVIASRFDDVQEGVASAFTDLPESHWAYVYVMSAYMKGWISGYPGGEFQPERGITRAEAVKIVNKMLGRRVFAADVPTELHTLYKDLDTRHWAFADVIEASVKHEYSRAKGGYEVWG